MNCDGLARPERKRRLSLLTWQTLVEGPSINCSASTISVETLCKVALVNQLERCPGNNILVVWRLAEIQ